MNKCAKEVVGQGGEHAREKLAASRSLNLEKRRGIFKLAARAMTLMVRNKLK